MALLFMDGFDAGDFNTKWAGNAGYTSSSVTRFSSGRSIFTTTNGNYKKVSISASSKIFVGFALMIPADPSTSYYVLRFAGDDFATIHLALQMNNDVTMGLYRGSTQLATFSVTPEQWLYIEVSAVISDTVGEVIIRLEGQQVVNFTGDTKNGGTNNSIDTIQIANARDYYYDDFYICDNTGATNNDFLGDVRVITAVPTAAGSATDLTPTGGDNYANVADIPDSTATYNSSVTAGHKDLYTMGDIPASVTTIHAVQANSHAWKTDAGTKSLKNAIKSGTTTAYGATVSLPTSVAHQGDIFEVDPDTSAAWTVSGVNGVEAGAEVV